MMQPHFKDRRGFTLTELTIVMGVIGLLMSGIWYGASKAREAQKENDALIELQTIAQNVYALMEGRSLPGPFTAGANNWTSALITAQVIPSSYVDLAATTAADTPWSRGSATVTTTNGLVVWQISANQFRVSFYGVPTTQACVALILGATSCQPGQQGCPSYISINAGYPIDLSPDATLGWAGATWQDGSAFTSASTNTWCAKNTDGINGGVEFTYTL